MSPHSLGRFPERRRSPRGPHRELEPSGLVVLRTPLLPFEEIEAWSAGLLSPLCEEEGPGLEQALAHDRALLRQRLQVLFERPEVLEALFVISPTLTDSLARWRRDPESRKGRRTERSLARYFQRMASRPNPVGLLAGCTAGTVGERTRLALVDRGDYRRRSRVDMDCLFLLCDRLGRSAGLRSELVFRPNSTLYETAGQLRYAESRPYGAVRRYHLVAVDLFAALRTAIELATPGARLPDLAAALAASDPDGEITLEEATSFLHDLVDHQILVPDLAPPVTGEEGAAGVLRQLAGLRFVEPARERLDRARRMLADLDAQGLGAALERYAEIDRELAPLHLPRRRLVQVDLIKPASEVVVGRDVIYETLRGIDLLHRVAPLRDATLAEFRKAFRERYGEEREMPLLEVLDEEIGIGFDRLAKASADASPLLADLKFQPLDPLSPFSGSVREETLLTLLTHTLAKGRTEVELTAEHIAALAPPRLRPLPDAFHTTVSLAADSPEALERGDFRLLLDRAEGPSGARLLGRFCHSDERIHAGVRAHLAAEEALAPETVYAEIVHLPAGRVGNVLSRPTLRSHEIAFLGDSGAPRERQIPIQDLTVTVIGDRVRLRSRRLGREVVPRLTAAHSTASESLGVYRLLGALQDQGRTSVIDWSWGPFERAAFLPRVTSGRLVLARARWRFLQAEIAGLARLRGVERCARARRWRRENRMPRFLYQHESAAGLLLIDFDNPLSFDAMIERAKRHAETLFTEVFPYPDELGAVHGPEGRFCHDLVIPFVRRRAEPPAVAAPKVHVRTARTFAPGTEWLCAKLYTGPGTADRLLLEEVTPLVHQALDEGGLRSWFFLRHADPAWHLQVCLRGDPDRLQGTILPRLQESFSRTLDAGAAWRCTLDTYQREVERYGGDEGIELAEELFFHDSEAVVALLATLTGDGGADLRWRLLLVGLDRLMKDFHQDLAARQRTVERERAGCAAGYRSDLLRGPLAERLRRDRPALESLLALQDDGPEELTAGREALAQRSRPVAEIVRRLQEHEREGRLGKPLEEIVPSFLHAFANRLSRSAGVEHEIVIYDYLARIYRSRRARGDR